MSVIPFSLRATVSKRGEAQKFLNSPGDAVLVERGGEVLWLLLKCPCGCGEVYPINLDQRAGPAWTLYRDGSGISVYPSVWRESGCESHYIIWRNKIWLIDHQDDDESFFDSDVPDLANAILASLSSSHFTSHIVVARQIGAIPWDVLTICRRLKREGRVVEGTNKEKGAFRLTHQNLYR